MAKFSNTVWNEYTLDDVKIVTNVIDYQGRRLKDARLECANGPSIANNVTLHSKLWPTERLVLAPAVLLDQNDELELEKYFERSNFREKRQIQLASSYTWILRTLPNKKVYLRTVCPTKINEDRRVFAMEVLDLIPILVNKKKLDKKEEALLRKYKNQWTLKTGIKSISLTELKTILEEFDVNKQRLTLVPDPTFVNEVTYRIHVAQGHSAVTVYGQDGYTYLDVTQAILTFFQGTVAELYWGNRFECPNMPGCMADCRSVYIQVMEHYALLEEGTYLSTSFVQRTLNDARNHRYYEARVTKPWTPILEFLYCDFNDKVQMRYLFGKFYNCDFGKATTPNDALLPVWRARVVSLIQWAEIFFAGREYHLEKIVLRGIGFKVPSTRSERDPNFIDMLFSENADVFEQARLVSVKCAGDIRSYFCAHPLLLTHGYQNWEEIGHIVRADKWAIREISEMGSDPSSQKEITIALAKSQKKLVRGRHVDEAETVKALKKLGEFVYKEEQSSASSEEETERVAIEVKPEKKQEPENQQEPETSVEVVEPTIPDKSLDFPLEYYKRKTALYEKELNNLRALSKKTTELMIDRIRATEQRELDLQEQLSRKKEMEEGKTENGELIEKLEAAMLKLKNQLAEKDETIRTLLDLLKISS